MHGGNPKNRRPPRNKDAKNGPEIIERFAPARDYSGALNGNDNEPDPLYQGIQGRLTLIGVAILIGLAVICARLWQVQVIDWAQYRAKSESNRLRIQRLEPPRGMIYGRGPDGADVALADNRAARDLMFVPAECDVAPDEVVDLLGEIVPIDRDALVTAIQLAIKSRQPHQQILVKKDVSRSTMARVEEYAHALPGVFTSVRPQRRYLYGRAGGQLLGYLNEIGQKELDDSRGRYHMGDLIGRRGIEQQYEDQLHGRDGQMLVTKFARGRPQIRTDAYGRPQLASIVDEYGHELAVEPARQDPTPGKSVYLTLDIELQRFCEDQLTGEEGAIAVLDAGSGAVLALASAPGYDPSVFVTWGTDAERRDMLTGKPNRMINRSFQEVYAPGSTFKILLALAALDESVITPNTTFYCPGQFQLPQGGRAWHCWRRGGHGNVSVVDALAFSCDVFFYNVGLELGVDRIKTWTDRIGLGVRTGLDLPGEVEGLIPSSGWKEALMKPSHPDEPWEWKWYPGETVNLSIGQGSTAVTPLQAAVMMASVINGGYRVTPFINRDMPTRPSERLFSEASWAVVVEGLRKCVEKGPPAPTGTGKEAKVEGFAVLGKTGSAQIVGLEQHAQYENEEDIPKEIRDHAWFVSGVMDREPPIAMCILVEHGHHGSSVAAPIAKKIIEHFYGRGDSSPLTIATAGGGT